ncbi:MAG: ACT domain-containing protein [Chitinophagales bacterium]
MAGETNINRLIASMSPQLHEGEYVFVTLKEAEANKIPRSVPIFEFKETEGITLILERQTADKLGLDYDFVLAWITLKIHSSLEAVGLTAAFSTELGKHGISCNVVAAFYHDHIFVAEKDADRAVQVLEDLSKRHQRIE